MKRIRYTFQFKPDVYRLIMKKVLFNDYHKETVIFQLLCKGYSCNRICDMIGYSERTIKRRRRSIYKKIENFLKDEGLNIDDCMIIDSKNKLYGNNFCVYFLLFPNNKVYIGQSVNTKNRWSGNGIGYKDNKIMYKDIQKYGWENVKKKIVYENLSYEESLEKEKELIIHYRSNIPMYGYNRDF